MAGEISPDIMFWAIRPKVSQMRAGGYLAVWVGSNRRVRKGKSKNRAKRAPNARAGDVFQCMYTVQKNIMSAGMTWWTREEQGEHKRGNKGCAVQAKHFKVMEKQEKQQAVKAKQQNENDQI